MPLPKPNKGESEKDFIKWCMANDTMVSEYPDTEQRTAVCYQQWGKKMNTPRMIIELADLKDAKLSEVVFIYPGKFDHPAFGEFKVTEKEIDHMVSNFNNGIATREVDGKNVLPCNYDHPDGVDTDPEKNKNSGLIHKLIKKDGVLKAVVEWTAKAREYIKNKEFLWISPEFYEDWQDENGKSHGVTAVGLALTNYPFLKKGMMAVALSDNSRILFSEKNIQEDQEMKDEIIKMLELKEDASEEDIIKAVEGLKEKKPDTKELDEEITKLKEKVSTLESEKTDLEMDLIEVDTQTFPDLGNVKCKRW